MKDIKKLFELTPSAEAFLITSQKNRFYFTGFSSTAGYLIIGKEGMVFITDFRYGEMAASLSQQGIKVIVSSGAAATEEIKNQFRKMGAVKIGFEDTEMTVAEYNSYRKTYDEFEFIPAGNSISQIRQIKTPEEIENIIKAQAITDKVFKHMLGFISVDMSEMDIAVELECQVRKLGGDGLAFDTIIASGENSSKPHAHPTMKKIKNGDPVTMDFGARYNGYCSDMTRTIFVGKPSAQLKNIYEIVLKAQLNTLENMKPGMTGKQLDALAREIITANGFGEYFQHSTGHSLGLDIHESPNLSAMCETEFKPNMLGTVEPGIYVSGLGGVRIEDLVVFTQDGVKNLTMSSKELIII